MKNRIILLFSLFILQSCYSPKTDVEKDKHPEIPEFPKFSDHNVYAVKVMELPLSQEPNCNYLVKDNYLYVYNDPGTGSNTGNGSSFFIITDGRLLISEKWRSTSKINPLAFIDKEGNIYVENRKYLAPDYRIKKILPFYDLDDIQQRYQHLLHVGEPEKDSALFRKISDEQTRFQKNIVGNISELLLIPDKFSPGILGYASYADNYLCNPDGKSFFVSHNILAEFPSQKVPDSLSSPEADPLYTSLRPKITLSQRENNFSSSIRKEYIDSVSFQVKDKIVSGNQWFSQGNHYVASFGYVPVYLYYYDVKLGDKTVLTKEDQTKIVIASRIQTNSGKYFLVKNKKEDKFQIYFLKN